MTQDPTALTCFEYITAALNYEDFQQMMLVRKSISEWTFEEEEEKSDFS